MGSTHYDVSTVHGKTIQTFFEKDGKTAGTRKSTLSEETMTSVTEATGSEGKKVPIYDRVRQAIVKGQGSPPNNRRRCVLEKVCLITLAVSASSSAADADPFVGMWKLNVAKSRSEGFRTSKSATLQFGGNRMGFYKQGNTSIAMAPPGM